MEAWDTKVTKDLITNTMNTCLRFTKLPETKKYFKVAWARAQQWYLVLEALQTVPNDSITS